MKKYILKKTYISIAFIIVSFALTAITFPVMQMPLFPKYFTLDLFYILAIAIICFSLPLLVQEIAQAFILVIEFILLIVSASLFLSRGDVFNWSLISQINQLNTVKEMIKIPVLSLIFGIIFIIGFVLVCIFIKTPKISLKQFYKPLIITIEVSSLALCSGFNVLIHHLIKNNYKENFYFSSDAYMYVSFSSSYSSLQKFGVYGYYFEDLFRQLIPACRPKIKPVNFNYEHYTSILNGLCPENNVIMIYAESFDLYGINKELTPVLYSMKNGADLSINGINDFYKVSKENNKTIISRKDFDKNNDSYNFNNVDIYQNISLSNVGLQLSNYKSWEYTNFSELKALKNSINYRKEENSLPNLLRDYNSTYIHGNWGYFYERDALMDNYVGFDNDIYLENMQDFSVGNPEYINGSLNVCSLDSVTIQHYTDNTENNCFPIDEKFFTYFLTVTTHADYTYSPFLEDNYLLFDAISNTFSNSEDFKLYHSLDKDLKPLLREYYARILDTEYALAYLVNYLCENDVLNKTIITFTGDHKAYGNDLHLNFKPKFVNQILKEDEFRYENTIEAFIYSTQITKSFLEENNESRKITHQTEPTDLMPTILTLLGRDYNQEYFIGNPVINKSVLDPTKSIDNKVMHSFAFGFVESDTLISYDGINIKSKNPNYKASQKEIDEFIHNYNYILSKNVYVNNKRQTKSSD